MSQWMYFRSPRRIMKTGEGVISAQYSPMASSTGSASPCIRRHQAAAIDRLAQQAVIATTQFDKSGQQINKRTGVGGMTLRHPRPGHDHGHAGRMLEEVHLVPQPALAQHVAMIGGDDDHGVVQARQYRRAP